MAVPTYEQLKPRYSRYWADMVPQQVTVIDREAAKLVRSKARYQAVGNPLGIPWWFIAILHNRESGGNFGGVLHNGEHIIGTGKKTRLVPAGRGPFSSWEQAADDALKLKRLHIIRDWNLERICYEAERFNGFGYFYHGVPSAYLWSYSNIYLGGKYIADGVWSAVARDAQLGVMPLLKRMMTMDASIRFGVTAPSPRITPEAGTAGGIGAGGAGAVVVAVQQGADPTTIIGILVAAVIVAGMAYFIIKKVRNR